MIDALVTRHLIFQWNSNTEQMEPTPIDFQNRQVLATLISLSGTTGYGYDEQAWKQWHFLRVKQTHASRAAMTPVRRDKR